MEFLYTLVFVVVVCFALGWWWPRNPHPEFMPRTNRRFMFGDRKASNIARYIEAFVYDTRPCWRVDSKVVETMARRWIRMSGYDGYRVTTVTVDDRIVYLICRGQQQIDQIGFPQEWFCDNTGLIAVPALPIEAAIEPIQK